MKSVSEVGILEEYRFYIRQNPANPTASMLTKAHFMPGTETAYPPPGGSDPLVNLKIDLADNILDLQVALVHQGPVPLLGTPVEDEIGRVRPEA